MSKVVAKPKPADTDESVTLSEAKALITALAAGQSVLLPRGTPHRARVELVTEGNGRPCRAHTAQDITTARCHGAVALSAPCPSGPAAVP